MNNLNNIKIDYDYPIFVLYIDTVQHTIKYVNEVKDRIGNIALKNTIIITCYGGGNRLECIWSPNDYGNAKYIKNVTKMLDEFINNEISKEDFLIKVRQLKIDLTLLDK